MGQRDKSEQRQQLFQAVLMAAQAHNLPTPWEKEDQEQLDRYFDVAATLQCLASKWKLNIGKESISAEALQELHKPAVVEMKTGEFWLIGYNDANRIIVFPPGEQGRAMIFADFSIQWTGKVYTVKPKFTVQNLLIRYNLAWFLTVLQRYKQLLGEVLAASFFLQFFGLLTPLFTQVLVDKVIGNNGVSTLDVLAIVLIVLYLFQSGLSTLRTYMLTHTTNKLDIILGTRLFRHLVSLPLPYFEQRRVGDTMMRISALSTVRNFLTGTAMTTALDAFFSIVFIGIMFYYSVTLTCIALATVPIYLFQNLYVMPIYRQRLEATWEKGAENNAFLVEAVTGMQTVKSLAVEPQFVNRWEDLTARYVRTTFDANTLGIGVNSISTVIQALGNFAILWTGGYMVMRGEMTLGQLIAFQMLASQATTPIMNLVSTWQSFQQAGLCMERMGDILNTRAEPVLQGSPPREPLKGEIVFENVSFRYRLDYPPVLHDISLRLPPGSRIGVVGRSGSGKSTLAKLLQRLYQPEQGRILFDGFVASELDPAWLRGQIGVVMQENYLYNGSVRDNVALARPSAPMAEVIAAAQLAGAHEFILELPEGYDTKVGERGTSLSGGQRQRIAIARALLNNPRILIFDEATSALDYESERIIMDNLERMAKGRTMLMVAHRLSTVRDCDLILVMDKGNLAEIGTHEELMRLQGLYARLYQQQEG